jgi:DNA-binding CsgD family transcriptional regulator
MPYLQQDDPGSTRHSAVGGQIKIGRSDENDVVLVGDMRVSRLHAVVLERGGSWLLLDLGSRNGTLLNGKRIAESPLNDGDRIKIGSAHFVYSSQHDPLATIPDTDSSSETRPALSGREREILALLGAGLTDMQIADRLFISVATVRSHLDRIRDKTGCRRRPELTRLAISLDLEVDY